MLKGINLTVNKHYDSLITYKKKKHPKQCSNAIRKHFHSLNISIAKKYDIREIHAEPAVTREQALPAKCSGEEHGKPRSDYATQRPQHQEK